MSRGRHIPDEQLVGLRHRTEVQAQTANDPETREHAEALLAALDELAERRQLAANPTPIAAISAADQRRIHADLSGRVQQAIRAAGSQAAFRRAHPDPRTGKPMSKGYLSDALNGEDTFGPLILDAIGVRKRVITIYEVVGDRPPQPKPHEGEAPCTDR